MSTTPGRPALEHLRSALTGVERFEVGPLDLDDACRQYTEEGYEVTPWLREFLTDYGELTVTWMHRDWEEELTTSVESAMDAPIRNVRSYARRIGRPVLPIGAVFSTAEYLLLAEDGEVLFGGDAGIQRVAHGFEAAVRALVTGDWDKTFF
ncbi:MULTISPECIES: SUKH-3 domain-containing protein [Kitasatospora]|uniref:SUKH-3 domain-containing protein n=1 Tax=Kitasatospora TaxID=2063 RepID=UPI002283E209|nr:SUKH-3 domain-containing protein [Kitasatospora sp. YST-16]WAL74358.1 SUKH-3 domain-containing protein [Kitasatospora sp. YST-16]WNW40424.1 SUKH-3 domain-containing protein [Streptomyces sp. Li-HN-5-13]